jgi:orotidine-5'-phosphate decarboxylase
MIRTKWAEGKFLCVGQDIDFEKLGALGGEGIYFAMMRHHRKILEATHDIVCAYKPNIAFYAAYRHEGLRALRESMQFVRQNYPSIPIILDAKRGDIGNTNLKYDMELFEDFEADAVTLNPYLGFSEFEPFLKREDKGIIALCRTSNRGAGEFQDLIVRNDQGLEMPLYLYVAHRASTVWNKNNNIALVVGATYPDEASHIRSMVGDMPFLIPGVGTQGGDVQKIVAHAQDSQGTGMIINSSSAIIYAKDPRSEALKTDALIRSALTPRM